MCVICIDDPDTIASEMAKAKLIDSRNLIVGMWSVVISQYTVENNLFHH